MHFIRNRSAHTDATWSPGHFVQTWCVLYLLHDRYLRLSNIRTRSSMQQKKFSSRPYFWITTISSCNHNHNISWLLSGAKAPNSKCSVKEILLSLVLFVIICSLPWKIIQRWYFKSRYPSTTNECDGNLWVPYWSIPLHKELSQEAGKCIKRVRWNISL